MSDSSAMKELTDLLMETGEAHHKAFHATDGADPDWPLWYGEYLLEPLSKALNADLTRSEIVYLVMTLEKQRMVEAPGAKWPPYYARELLARYL